MCILIPHVVLGGGEADVQVSSADSCPLKGVDGQARCSQVIEGQYHKAAKLAGCVQRPDLPIRLHNTQGSQQPVLVT